MLDSYGCGAAATRPGAGEAIAPRSGAVSRDHSLRTALREGRTSCNIRRGQPSDDTH